MPNRLFYTIKLSSGLLKEYDYVLNLTFEQCLKNGLVISLSDSQMLKSVRDITGQKIDREQLELLYEERNRLKRSKTSSKPKRDRIRELQKQIYDMMYIPQYITVLMDNVKDYERMFKNGFIFNGRRFKRASCSASQARVSTIVFVEDTIEHELKRRLDCGRDLNHPLAASKYNAYYGLYSSASKKVTKPRFCVIPDFCEDKDIEVNFCIETDWDSDDIIEQRTISQEFNRFDGSGIISPEMAKQWGEDLGEDYTPSQFCIRCAFTKGLVNIFDFVEWCKCEKELAEGESEDDRYIITDIYGKKRDLREIDVIITEGMAKLWDSWDSQESFEYNCSQNGIEWRVTKYAPKVDKDMGLMNYQYLQTLDFSDDEENKIKAICSDTIKYIEGVTYQDPYYSLLFMCGSNMDEEKIIRTLDSSDNYWLKSLILERNLFNDKYSQNKIRDLIVKRIEDSCLGRLLVNGNYQAIVPDNYGLMEWVCYRDYSKVHGLLKDGEFYSQFWTKKGSDRFACARSPMTGRSEWFCACNAGIYDAERRSEETQAKIDKYYQYSYSGIITNIHGIYTMTFAGSDFDFDILFTSDNKVIIDSMYNKYGTDKGMGRGNKELVVTYNTPKPKKKSNLSEEDLYEADTFSFGQQIGQLTNYDTSIYAMLPLFEDGTKEKNLLEDRIRMCVVSQSKQIDKTKIGQAVKCIPKVWTMYQKINDDDTPEIREQKEFYNSLVVDKKPYFFKYKYKQLSKDLNEYNKTANENSLLRYSKPLSELLEEYKKQPNCLTLEELRFLEYYFHYLPVLDTPCVMNKICKYIESIDFGIKKKIKSSTGFDYKVLQSGDFNINKKIYQQIKEEVENTFKYWEEATKAKKQTKVEQSLSRDSSQSKFEREVECQLLKQRLEQICSNEEQLANHLVYLFYVDKQSFSKSTLWNLVGKQLFENIKKKNKIFYFPVLDENGDLEFLYKKYQIKKLQYDTENVVEEYDYVASQLGYDELDYCYEDGEL